jgi:hypothetical protein
MSALAEPLAGDDATTGKNTHASLKAGRREPMLVAPVLVLASEYPAFQGLTAALGPAIRLFPGVRNLLTGSRACEGGAQLVWHGRPW